MEEALEFLQPMAGVLATEDKLRVLDVGCGDGIHAVALQGIVERGMRFSGIDASEEALRQARNRVEGSGQTDWNFGVANALHLPYADESFDVVFSYGVLYYTGDMERGFKEMVRVCRSGGLVGLWVFPEAHGVLGRLFKLTRQVCHAAGPVVSKAIVNCIVPFLPMLPVRSGVSLSNASWRQCAEVIAVNLLPEHFEFSSPDRVLRWFRDLGLEVAVNDSRRPVAIWGTRQ